MPSCSQREHECGVASIQATPLIDSVSMLTKELFKVGFSGLKDLFSILAIQLKHMWGRRRFFLYQIISPHILGLYDSGVADTKNLGQLSWLFWVNVNSMAELPRASSV
ncbi:TPA: hypothetical protein I7730_00530 [Vibrio vulnificus]|uniref:Uncharacterized protein n=1 Tax=Vibrio vulnificus TaxID=672 RepID=A0A8H9K719_VIBVL|nr:hypothetical protein [Vibrio vulnificus]